MCLKSKRTPGKRTPGNTAKDTWQMPMSSCANSLRKRRAPSIGSQTHRIDDDLLYLTDDRYLARNRRVLSKLLNDISVAIKSTMYAALGPPIDEGRLLRLLHARRIEPSSRVAHPLEKEGLWESLLHRNASAVLCDAMRALWVERIVEHFDPYTIVGSDASFIGLEVRAMDAFCVDFGQP